MNTYYSNFEKINKDEIYLYDETLAKKYNAIVNFFNNRDRLLEMGCYGTTFQIFYIVEDDYTNKILIKDTWEKYIYEITNPKRLRIDRRFKILKLIEL